MPTTLQACGPRFNSLVMHGMDDILNRGGDGDLQVSRENRKLRVVSASECGSTFRRAPLVAGNRLFLMICRPWTLTEEDNAPGRCSIAKRKLPGREFRLEAVRISEGGETPFETTSGSQAPARRAASPVTSSRTRAMCSGPIRQHPPTMSAPSESHSPAMF